MRLTKNSLQRWFDLVRQLQEKKTRIYKEPRHNILKNLNINILHITLLENKKNTLIKSVL